MVGSSLLAFHYTGGIVQNIVLFSFIQSGQAGSTDFVLRLIGVILI